MKPRLLVLDDEPDVGELVAAFGEACGYSSAITTSPADFLERTGREPPEVVVLDLALPGHDGIELMHALAERDHAGRVVLMSGADTKVLRTARQLGEDWGLAVCGILQKPFTFAEFERLPLKTGSPPIRRRPDETQPLDGTTIAKALENGEIGAWFQPKVGLGDGRVRGFEALARWLPPDGPPIPPDRFVPAAQSAGLMGALTARMLDDALEACGRWREAGLDAGVAVNIAPDSLRQSYLPTIVADALHRHGVATHCLTLEVTESASLEHIGPSLGMLPRLRLRGIRLSLDDFGTGYWTMSQLARLPFNELKIDRSFIERADDDPVACGVLESLIGLGHRLSMTVVAEGVETAIQWHRLSAMGCDMVQGYLVAPPMRFEAVATWSETWRVPA